MELQRRARASWLGCWLSAEWTVCLRTPSDGSVLRALERALPHLQGVGVGSEPQPGLQGED